MNPITSKYVTHKNLDVVLSDIIDFVGTCYDAHEENLTKVKNEVKLEIKKEIKNLRDELKADINKVRFDLQIYQENNSKIFAEMRKDIDEIKASQKKIESTIEEIKDTNKELKKMYEDLKKSNEELRRSNNELKDMNKHILGLISYQESRLREVEKNAHTHSTDML
jgi:chromosome segregation ATPase